jgi:hypothetical protein
LDNFLSVISGLGGGVVRLGLGVDGGTFVFDISDITVVVISGVGDGLDTTIGKSNLVRSSDNFAISGLLSVEFGSGVVIGNTVLESIRLGGLIGVFGMRSRVVRSGGICWGRGSVCWGSSGESDGNSHEGGEGGNTKHDK